MQIVDQPYFAPGVCMITGVGGPEAGPYIDLLRSDPYGNRLYIRVQVVLDMIRLVDGGGPQEMEVLRELTERKEELEQQLEDAMMRILTLESGIAMTLSIGAVFDRETGRPRLRKPPGGYVIAKEGEQHEVVEPAEFFGLDRVAGRDAAAEAGDAAESGAQDGEAGAEGVRGADEEAALTLVPDPGVVATFSGPRPDPGAPR